MAATQKATTSVSGHERKKRKHEEDENDSGNVADNLRDLKLDMDSEDEAGDSGGTDDDDGEHHQFPELDVGSDSESDDDDYSDAEEEEEEDEEEEEEESNTSQDDLEDDTKLPGLPPQGKMIRSEITGHPKRVYPEIEPEYDSDSSTENAPNRVGNIPLHWYDDLPHVGYDVNGKKVLKPAKGDELDKFLSTIEDPSAWTSGYDNLLQKNTELSAEELDIIRRLHASEVPDASYDPYEPTVEWFTGKGKEEIMPLSGKPEPKRRWVPSKWEKQKVMKIVRAIRAGRILPRKPTTTSTEPQFYSLWSSEPSTSHPPPLPAPKPALPTHAESYNPPPEYLPSESEKEQWESTEKEDRERNYLPKKYPALRNVPGYDQFIQERFSRLLDLYLAPRIQRKKLNIDPNSLIPSLPSPQSLKPFPVYEAIRHSHNLSRVRCLSISPNGAWIVSGDENGCVKVWEALVGREAARWDVGGKVGSVAWCPKDDVSFFLVGVDEAIHFFVPPYLSPSILAATTSLLHPIDPPQPSSTSLKWSDPTTSPKATATTPFLTIQLPAGSGLPKQLTFHRRGDYFASVSDGEGQGAVWIHQLSKRHSQAPFKKIKGTVQRVAFHPTKPNFFVATQRYVRMYDLAAQKLLKTLMPGIRWISSLDIHPSGDHLIVGGYDRKLCWFDLELSDKPYKVLRYHSRAIRSLAFHPTYPLFASSSDDGTIQIFHSRVYSDLMTDPLIVPLKILRGHEVKDGLGVLDVRWCRGLPWLASAGADGDVVVWCN